MKTFTFSLALDGKITVPDAVLRDVRAEAARDPKTEGGSVYLNAIHNQFPDDDDKFLQAALQNALRAIVRQGIVTDVGNMGEGIGVRAAPARVEVSVPERVVTRIGDKQQLPVVLRQDNDIALQADDEPGNLVIIKDAPFPSHGEAGALEQADSL